MAIGDHALHLANQTIAPLISTVDDGASSDHPQHLDKMECTNSGVDFGSSSFAMVISKDSDKGINLSRGLKVEGR